MTDMSPEMDAHRRPDDNIPDASSTKNKTFVPFVLFVVSEKQNLCGLCVLGGAIRKG